MKNLIFERFENGGETWEKIDKEEVEKAINKAYVDGGLMMANMISGLTVITPFAKYRAKREIKNE